MCYYVMAFHNNDSMPLFFYLGKILSTAKETIQDAKNQINVIQEK